jgi:hypothetical protein
VAKFGKDPIYRNKVIMQKRSCCQKLLEYLTTGSFLDNSFSSVYWILTKFGHMFPLWKGKNPVDFGVIRSKVKVTYYKYNLIYIYSK